MKARFPAGLLSIVAAVAFAQQTLRFDVASVKPSPDVDYTRVIRASKKVSSTRATYRTLSLRRLILDEAFDLSDYQLDGPGWLSKELFDVEVLKPAGTTSAQFRSMMQTLLSERFRMRSHFVERRMSSYILLPEIDRRKLQPATEKEKLSGCPVGTLDDVARIAQKILSRPVVNQTGTSGLFRIRMVVSADLNADNRSQGEHTPAPPPAPPPPNVYGCPGWENPYVPAAASVEQALRDQMGLTIKKSQDVSVRVLVVDQISMTPTPN